MKNVFTIAAMMALSIAMTSCTDQNQDANKQENHSPAESEKNFKPDYPKPTEDDLESALSAVKKEPAVISAAWSDKAFPILFVGVSDDGSRRDGYAEYICQVLAAHRVYGGVVHILDNNTNDHKELGKHWCKIKPSNPS